jgi:hypothetical protein
MNFDEVANFFNESIKIKESNDIDFEGFEFTVIPEHCGASNTYYEIQYYLNDSIYGDFLWNPEWSGNDFKLIFKSIVDEQVNFCRNTLSVFEDIKNRMEQTT